MQHAEKLVRSYLFSLAGKLIFALFLIISIIGFVMVSTIKVHSESDVKYKQQSIFNDAGLRAGVKREIINTNYKPKEIVIEMSFEVDKVTPTPTPIIVVTNDDIWMKLAECESHRNWSSDTGNGYFGGLQFSMGAWASVGGQGKPSDASADEQISRGQQLQQKRGWGPWGGCSKKLGLI